ncbi:LysR family transcriptional regulator [Bisgaard Taxon 10/6]|uniref:LysR family transcriptional regulator n=1 Tax=Exercitatus varius TaxID=67857 RepID=A0ABT6EQL2_9PAST|nr:LysR family transcriptional regulator [Exercitatus varius]QOF68470.1 LysR family transcriptional regulator [Actinobacillus sp. GY-402]MDG2918455.1 LysR family transcriptional regulator [Exercitatus varius]MDG2938965.1 LysR family transcriptional regulator [Exercitatus varius]MDG2941306.1 LysR family transcriptional regulator [Exercitatus varius]MDG2945837.1 LysR family transcriptional regulator [Exercitatus varius]
MNLNLDWNDIHYFLLLVENQTLTATANVLNVEHSTVSRRIERLEKELNVHLFNRIHKRYLLTDDGKRLYTEAKKLQFNVRQFAQTAQDSRQAMTEVLLSVPPFVSHELIAPLLREFYQKFNHIRLVLIGDLALSSLHDRQADIALRIVLPEQHDLVAKRLFDVHYRWYAHTDYLAQASENTWQFLGLNLNGTQLQWVEQQLADKCVRFACNDFGVMKSAIMQKLGIGLLPDVLGDRVGLVRIANMAVLTTSMYLIMHQDVRKTPPVRAVADFLVEKLGE